mgnify:CR=1 FL=1
MDITAIQVAHGAKTQPPTATLPIKLAEVLTVIAGIKPFNVAPWAQRIQVRTAAVVHTLPLVVVLAAINHF